MTSPPAVVLYLGITGLEIARCLGRRGIDVVGLDTNIRQPAAWSRYCVARRCADPVSQPDELVTCLADLGRVLNGGVLFPASDAYVAFVARHRDVLQQWFRVPLPDPGVVESLMDKRRLHGLAASQGVPVPRTCIPRDVADVEAFARAARYPCLLKPAVPHEWWRLVADSPQKQHKVVVVHQPDDLVSSYRRLAEVSSDLVVQEVVQRGEGGACYVTCHIPTDGSAPSAFAHRKLRTYPLDFGVGTLIESVHEPQLVDRAISLLKEVGYRGIAGLEFIYDARDGEARLIEVNARYGVGDSLGALCGLDLAFRCYADVTGMGVPRAASYRIGPRWVLSGHDLLASLGEMARRRMSPVRWIRSLTSAECHWDLFARDDPWPVASAPAQMPHVLGRLLCQSRRGSKTEAAPQSPGKHPTAPF